MQQVPVARVPLDEAVLRWPTPRSRQWVTDFLERAEQDNNVLAVIAVGSAIRPDVSSEDVDLVVLCREAGSFGEEAPIEVDLRAYDAASAASRVSGGHHLLGWTLEFGKLLFQKDHVWDDLVAGFPEGPPLPSPKKVRECAQTARGHVEELLRIGDEDAAREQLTSLLTHLSREALIRHGVYPASRPELPAQLRDAGESQLAHCLQDALGSGEQSVSELLESWDLTPTPPA